MGRMGQTASGRAPAAGAGRARARRGHVHRVVSKDGWRASVISVSMIIHY